MTTTRLFAAAVVGAACLSLHHAVSVAAQEAKASEQQGADTKSALARLTATLKPETWAVLNKDGDESGYGAKFTDSGGGLFGYASKATYDPARRRVFFFGSGHHGRSTPEYYAAIIRFIVYEVDKNRWTRISTP